MVPMKSLIMKFLRDESGAEAIELGIAGAIIAAGSVAGLSTVKDGVKEKNIDIVRKLFNADSN